MIKNPFIEDSPTIYQEDIPKDFLIKKYQEKFNLDISSILSSTDRICVYKCLKSGYRFYFPFEITGDSLFYERLQQNDWYYMPWKWEHQISLKIIKDNLKILEVGCGKGDFLKQISKQFENIRCVGLELNKSSAFSDDKVVIYNSTIEDFSTTNQGIFDIVCSFQVLEHIPEVNDFLKANIKCLKNDGFLVISVPNSDSFIKYDKNNILNMPPHHMGLWNEKSLLKIGEYYNLELVEILFEPLQTYHIDWYISSVLNGFFGKTLAKISLKTINLFKFGNIIEKSLKARANKIKGHSILIVFKKTVNQ